MNTPNPGEFLETIGKTSSELAESQLKAINQAFSEVHELVRDCKYQEARELALGVYKALCKTEDKELQVYAMLAKSQLTLTSSPPFSF